MEWVSHYVIGRKHCCTDHSLIMRGQLICRITQVRSTSVKSFRQSFQKTIFSNTINIFRNLLNYLFYISRISLRVQRIIFLESIKFFIPFFYSAWMRPRVQPIKSTDQFVPSEYSGEKFLEISWLSLVNFEKFDLTTRTNVLQFKWWICDEILTCKHL